MKELEQIIVFNNIKLPIDASVQEAFSVALRKLRKISAEPNGEPFVFRRSIDARHKDDIKFVYSIAVRVNSSNVTERDLSLVDSVIIEQAKPEIIFGTAELEAPPIVVGSGPCGLFSALLLAELGYDPIILERGGSVSERISAVDEFIKTKRLNTRTNIQYGAGGAGTFSDGKLVTRINDPLTGYVLDKLIEFGAPESIRYIAKPHVGTDILSVVVDRILSRIIQLGGRVEYNTTFLYSRHSFGRISSVITDKGKFPAGALILAIGHSARDTYRTLIDEGLSIEAKSFSVGMRIEHLAEDIDRSMYGNFAGHPSLGHAEYNLSYNTKVRGIYTFCMCPGGEVVAAASEDGGLVVNGMSYNSRSGKNSNSAVVCSIFKEDYGSTPTAAIDFQREIERSAYIAGGGNYSAPIITVGDFLSDRLSHEPSRITPTYMGGTNVKLARPDQYLPKVVTDGIRGALTYFDKRISGFAADDAILCGAETRTSAPIRILRDPITRLATGYTNLYPAGEGAGYAGGITSAAIDGIKSALALIRVYKPKSGR